MQGLERLKQQLLLMEYFARLVPSGWQVASEVTSLEVLEYLEDHCEAVFMSERPMKPDESSMVELSEYRRFRLDTLESLRSGGEFRTQHPQRNEVAYSVIKRSVCIRSTALP